MYKRQALFGYDITGRADEVGQAMDTMVTIGKPRHRKGKEAIDLVDSIVYTIIDDRRAHQMCIRDSTTPRPLCRHRRRRRR